MYLEYQTKMHKRLLNFVQVFGNIMGVFLPSTWQNVETNLTNYFWYWAIFHFFTMAK